MFAKAQLRQEIETALAAPATSDPLQAAKREFGLRFIVEARRDQTLADVAAYFHGISPRFEVEPFYSSPVSQPSGQTSKFPAPDPARPSWRDVQFVANVCGVSVDQLATHPWDVAHAARVEAGFAKVTPDLPLARPQGPELDAADGRPVPTKWVFDAMKIRQAWRAIEFRGGQPGSKIEIGHPDTGWYPHEVFPPGKLNLAKSRNFMPGEQPDDARDRLDGAQKGHGTSTASVMVASKGGTIEGVAPHAVVVPIRCISNVVLYPGQREVALAIAHAREQRCRVISLSLGGFPGFHGNVSHEVLEAVRANIVVVAAAGQGIPGRITAEPACMPFCVGVAGLEGLYTGFYRTWEESSRSPPGSVKISAPATPILRAVAGETYGLSSGTSYATALMAGVAALWLAYHFPGGYPGAKTVQDCFIEHLQRTAVKPNGFDPWFFGVVDAQALIQSKPKLDLDETEAEPEADLTAVAAFARLLGGAPRAEVENLLADTLLEKGQDRADLESWTSEVAGILPRHEALWRDLAAARQAGTLDAETLRTRLEPVSSSALRRRLSIAGAVVAAV